MNSQVVTIELPEISYKVNGKTFSLMKHAKVQVDNAQDIKRAIKKRVPRDQDLWEIKQKILRTLEKGITVVTEDGTRIDVPLGHKWGWQFDINISDSMINKVAGKRVPVTYGNFVHNALYKMSKEGDVNVSNKAKATLISLEYVKNGSITETGCRILEVLEEQINPATDKSCRMKFTRALFEEDDPFLPAFTFAKDNGYLHWVYETDSAEPWYVNHFGDRKESQYYPTKKGAKWLEENCVRILKHHSCSAKRRFDMISFMPAEYLNAYLTSKDPEIRRRATMRLDVVEGNI